MSASQRPPNTPPEASAETFEVDPGIAVGHIHLKVADLDRALVFWSDVMGFDVTTRMGDEAAFLSGGGYHHHIGLNTWTSAGGSPPAPGTTGLFHVAFVYPSRASLARAVQRLVDVGWPLMGAADHGVSEAVYLEDADGNGVELYRDRPRDQWPDPAPGEAVGMYTRPLDVQALLAEA